MTRIGYGLVGVVSVLALSACRGERSTFATGWKDAAAQKDGRRAWDLLDEGSQKRILDGLERARQAMSTNPTLASLIADANAPVDMKAPSDKLATALLAAGIDRMALVDDGVTTRVHPEGRAWRARVEPVGFVAERGVPVSLTLRFSDVKPAADMPAGTTAHSQEPGEDGVSVIWVMKDSAGGDLSTMTPDQRDEVLAGKGRLVKDKIAGFTFRPAIEGHTSEEIAQQCVRAAARIAAEGKLWIGVEPEAARLMKHYLSSIGKDPTLVGVSFSVDQDGGLTAITRRFNREQLHEVEQPQPRLAFGAWP